MNTDLNIIFFGTPDIAVTVLNELKSAGMLPSLIVTNEDRPQGRKMILTAPPTKIWAEENDVEVLQPESLRDSGTIETLKSKGADLYIVVAYGKIIPKEILDIPKHGVLNVHPSLLPKLRGASPIRSAILNNTRETGVTIMLLDEDLDHGPILSQKATEIDEASWPLRGQELDKLLAKEGGTLLADTVPKWIAHEIKPTEQNHAEATFCTKITKDMGEISLDDDPYQNLLKIRAFDGWPGTYFFKDGKRIKITDAELAQDGSLKILKVIPEGKSEQDYQSFVSN